VIDEVANCAQWHPEARTFLETAVLSSLLGLYPGSSPAPLAARRRVVAAHLSPHAVDRAGAESIVTTLLRLRCQQTLFFVLKEALVYLVNACNHPVRVVLEQYHGWREFCGLVCGAMNRARAALSGTEEDLLVFERCLTHVSKQKIRRLFARQPSQRDWEAALTLECEKFYAADSRRGRSHHWGLLQRAALRAPHTEMPLGWLRGMARRPEDTPAQTLARLRRLHALVPALTRARKAFFADGSKTVLRAVLSEAGSWDEALVEVAALAAVFRQKRTTHFCRLPAHVCVAQIRALRRVYRVPDGTPLAQCPPRMGVIGVCQECHTVRSFLTPKRAKASNGLVAFGYAQSLVDAQDPTAFYCGRKPAAGDREHSTRGAKTGKALRHARCFGTRCADTKLTSVNLIGRLLVFRGKHVLGICCFCGNFFCAKGLHWHGCLLACGRCIDKDGRKLYESTSCDWCGKQCRTTHLAQLWTADRKKRQLCKTCTRPRFANAPAYSVDWKTVCDDLTGVHSARRR